MKIKTILGYYLILLTYAMQVKGQFSWRNDTPAYPEGNVSGHNYTNVGGTPSRDVAISPFAVGSGAAWQASNPRVPTGTPSRLTLGVNHTTNDPANATVSVTLTFSSPVCGLTFSLYEIDRGGTVSPYTYVDEVNLAATTEGGGSVPTPSIMPSAFASVSGSTITGIASDGTASPGAATTITYPATHCVKTLTFTYRTGANVQSNPLQQLISIGDMNWNSAQPVTLTQFQSEATQEGISLSWQTSEETNNSHFEVERSSDARSFEAIGRIDGRGNSTENQSYTFADLAPRLGLNYYRLKQVDFDGASEYSRMIVAQYNGSGTFRVYPNPTADFIAVELPENTEAKSYQLKDLYGRVVSTFTKLDAISLKHLVPSMYHLEVLTVDGKRFYQKILIQR